MEFPIREIGPEAFPPLLNEIPDPPTSLTYRGELPPPDLKLLAVVGSRNYTTYGKQVVDHLIRGLRGYPVGIVSGMALGIDSLAHRAALDANLYTLAVPGGGLNDDVLYPRSHVRLAREILASGGGLLSEFEPHFKATPWSFPQRNRIVTGMTHATLLIEAAERSGTLISARLASDYDRDLMVVPGNIFSANTAGCHQFLKLGAIPVTSPEDILDTLGIDRETVRDEQRSSRTYTEDESKVLAALTEPMERDELIRATGIPAPNAAAVLMALEVSGDIAEDDGIIRRTH